MSAFQVVLLSVGVLGLIGAYGCLLIRAYSKAYFEEKLDYQRRFFHNFKEDGKDQENGTEKQ